MFAVQGLARLEHDSLNMTAEDLVSWLRRGFDTVDTAVSPADIGGAFAPLHLNPASDPLAQLATGIREALTANLSCAQNLVLAVRTYLDDPENVPADDPGFLVRLWHLLGAVGLPADAAATARTFVDRMQLRRNLDVAAFRRLIAAVAGAIAASAPPTGSQPAFFVYLRDNARLWQPWFITLAIDVAFARAGHCRSRKLDGASTPEEVWHDLLGFYFADLQRSTNPHSPAGRALLRSLDRHLAYHRLQSAEEIEEFETYRNEIGLVEEALIITFVPFPRSNQPQVGPLIAMLERQRA